MILFDTTEASSWRHASGLARVSGRLRAELGDAARETRWPGMRGAAGPADWVLTPELFSEAERPGFGAFLEERPCRLAAVYHDAIPIKHPGITWPKSVERHPGYMKLLARFDRVWAVSAAGREELLGFWRWQGVAQPPPVDVLPVGADWEGLPRAADPAGGAGRRSPPRIVSVGILEPRKNQAILLDACGALRQEGLEMELHLVGRVNPHFGGPIAQRIGAMRARWPGLRHHAHMDDAALAGLVRTARATALASIAEGCGLPLLESLWMGVPCLCSDIAPLVENAAGGGCAVVAGNDLAGWREALRRVLTDDAFHARLLSEASARPLPTWAGAARVLREALA
ncbi:MAG TPA: glycosyltransferase [Opitutaceae bacterium]|nr:glycosyltransferase [Opitutaceae bacterium]